MNQIRMKLDESFEYFVDIFLHLSYEFSNEDVE